MVDYYGGKEKQLEAAIPILIILLLIVGVAVLRPEVFQGIPVIGDFFGGETTKVLVIGDQATERNGWADILKSDMSRKVFGNPLNVDVVLPAGGDIDQSDITGPYWIEAQKYDLVVVTGTQLSDSLQLTLKEWVMEGGSLLVVGEGGIQPNGRWAELTNVLPVRCGLTEDCTTYSKTVYAPELSVDEDAYSQKINQCIDTITPLTENNESIVINDAQAIEEGNSLVIVEGFNSADEVQAGSTGILHSGILERSFGVSGGKVVYMSFNPTTQNINPDVEKSLVINMVAYAVGESCYKP